MNQVLEEAIYHVGLVQLAHAVDVHGLCRKAKAEPRRGRVHGHRPDDAHRLRLDKVAQGGKRGRVQGRKMDKRTGSAVAIGAGMPEENRPAVELAKTPRQGGHWRRLLPKQSVQLRTLSPPMQTCWRGSTKLQRCSKLSCIARGTVSSTNARPIATATSCCGCTRRRRREATGTEPRKLFFFFSKAYLLV
jgi:hypothetical protein